MPNWDDLRYLLAVARGKTMIAAANEMATNVATVSRHIQKLSENLGYSALVKSADGWRINDRLVDLLSAAEEFDHKLRAVAAQPEEDGDCTRVVPLRVGSPPLFTATVILPRLAELRQTLPRVALSVHTRLGGEGLGEYDLVIAAERPQTGRLILRRLRTPAYGVFQLTGAPASSDWIGLNDIYDDFPAMKSARAHFGRPPVLRLTHYQQILEAARITGLPALLPSCSTTSAAGLVKLDGGPPLTEGQRWVYFHESRKGDPVLGAFLNWLIEADRDADSLTRQASTT